MNKVLGCLGLLVLVVIAVLLFALVRNRVEPAAQPQPVAPPIAQPTVQQSASGQVSAPTQPMIRIVSPATGARVRVGQAFQVHVVVNDPSGVASIAFAVDGQQGAPVNASAQTTFATALPITLQSKGIHTIAVQANNGSGTKSQPVAIRVVAVQSLSDPTNPGDPPAPIPDVPTDPVSPSGNQVAPSGATVNFAANPTSIAQGQCSTLRWDVDGVREVYLEGVGVTGHEQQQACPTQTTTYTLNVVFQDGSARNYPATVNVSAAIIVAGKPDLVITDAHIEPSEATTGQSFNAMFTVANRGDVASGPFTVFWQFHEATGLKNCCSREFPNGIAAKAWGGGTFPNLVTNSRAGTSPSWVEIDYGNRVDEGAAGEGNNKVNLTLTVKASGSVGQAPPAPRNCRGNPSGAGAYLAWETGQPRTWDGFRVYARGSNQPLKVFDNPTTIAGAIENLTPNTTYQFDIRAYNAVGESPANACTVEVKTAASTPFQVTQVSAEVEPEIFSGTCPKSVTYTGKITTNGAGTISYRWVRSDGTGETRTLNFSAAGTQAVASVNMNYAHSATHWAKLEVLAPNAMSSDQAKFTLNCASPAIVTLASVNINPTAFTGSCPHTFHFNGTIVTNAPGTVTYRWERSDGTGETRTLNFASASSQTVQSGDFKSGSSGTFWARLHVLTPNDKVSNQAQFVLTCK